MYPVDNREMLVPNGKEIKTPPPAYMWVYGGNHGDVQTLINEQYLVGQNQALFAPYIKDVKIYKCASDRSTWPTWTGGQSVLELRSYAMNCYMGTPNPATTSDTTPLFNPISLYNNYRVYLKSSDIALNSPANRFVFIDVNPASICTPGFGVDMDTDQWVHYPSTLNWNRGILSYADGRAETRKWLDARTRKAIPTGSQYIPHFEASPGNQDLYWLRLRTTTKR